MFRHRGKSRKLGQNLGIASLLSFVAGIVNVAGFLEVQTLTTNVTGHFALLVEEALHVNFEKALAYFLYIFFFFTGAFVAHLLIGLTSRITAKYTFVVPVLVEMAILLAVALLHDSFIQHYPNLVACSLLFAMGLQNSLVTTISSSVVRTTHLTGLFTDMGIEMSQLLFRHAEHKHEQLKASVKLRLIIILAFFLGGISAGLLFASLRMKVLLVAVFVLASGLLADAWQARRMLTRLKQQRHRR